MKNFTFFLKRGLSLVNGPTLDRYWTDNGPRTLIAILCLLFTLGVGNVWGAATTYNFSSIPTTGWSTSGKNVTINGKTWTYSASTYIGSNGSRIQVGSSNNPQGSNWTIQIAVSSFGSGKKITAVAITGYATQNASYSSYDISVGGSSVKSGSFTTSSNTYTASGLNVTSGNIVVTLKGETGTYSTKALYLSNIAVTYDDASSTCTLHHGAGGSTTTNKTQGSGTLGSGNAVAGWTFSHWSTSQQTSPSASTPGTIYYSGATTPAQANLYAFYQNDCNNLYCTAPTAVYHIVNMGPAVSGGDDDDYFYTTVGGNNSVFCNIASGTTVYLTGHIGTGHSFHEWHVTKTDDASTTVTVTNPTAYDGTAYFTMPAYNVDIEAEFCQTPTQPTVTVVPSLTSATVNWTTSTGASLYRVMILNEARDVNVTGTQDVNAPTITKNMTGLQPLTNYYAAVRSQNPCGGYVDKQSAKFTTLGYTVTYNQSGEDVTTSVPTDANQYGASGSVTLLDKNSESHKADYYFAGWTDNNSGTGTVYKPGDTYTITGNVTFYAKWVACSAETTPSSLSVSGSGSSNITFSWGAVTGATKYQLVLMDENTVLYEFETTSTSKTVNISEVGGEGEYMGQVRACNGTIGYCYEDFTDDIEFAAGCANYSFHYGTRTQSDWNDPADCFVASSDADGNTGYFYYIEDFELPTKPHYYVGWQGSWNTSDAKSADADFSDLCFGLVRDNQYSCGYKTLGTYSAGNNQGAVGTLRVRSSYTDNNKYIDFIPAGYVLSLSENNGSTYSTTSLTAASSSLTETVWTTDITTVSSNLASSGKFFVDLATSDSHVWTPNISQVTATSSMGYKTNSGDNWGTGLSSGMRGKFRIWADNCSKNWNCHFVPYHRIIFHSNYPAGGGPADTYSVDVSVEETNSSIALASAPSAPTGYSFDGWYTAASGGTKRTGNQTISAGASADTELYAHWAANTHSVNYSAPSNGNYTISVAGGSATSATKSADYGQTVTLAATANTGYEFSSWDVYKTGESGTKVTVTSNQFTMPDYDVTVTASFSAINYNVTYSAPTNGNYTIKVASGSASSATKTANYGQTITLAATPSEGYQLSSWTIRNTSTSADVTASVSLSSTTSSPATFTMPAYGVTVIATFSARNYTLTWDWNGGSTSSTTHTAGGSVAYGTTIVYPANGTMSKEGHSFTGWSPNPATMPAANTTIQAQWSVNNYNVAVASVDHVTITATPAGEAAIGEGANRNVDYGKSVTLAYSSLDSKNYWGGWKVTNAGGDDVTASVVDGNTLTVPAYAVTVSAVTYGDLIAWCDPNITVSGDIHLTSKNGVSVYATSTTNNLIRIQSTDLASVNKLGIKYLDANDGDAEVAKGSSVFRFCNDGSVNYNVADGSDISVSGTCDLTYSISYTPTAYDVTHHYKLQVLMKHNSTVIKTVTLDLFGRSLPEEFVIATKGNDNIWYALPNTIVDNTNAVSPIRIIVNNATTPTAATYAPNTTVYKGDERYNNAANRYAVRFTDGVVKDAKLNHLQISSSTDTHYPWLSYTGSSTNQDWWLSSSDCSAYTMKVPTSGATSSYVFGIYGGNIGFFSSVTSGSIYILPITNKLIDVPATVTEWGKKSIVLDVDAQTAVSAQAHFGDRASAEKTASFGQTRTSVKGSDSKYNYTLSFSTTDFSAHKGELLYIDWLDGGDNVIGTSQTIIPWIIASTGTMSSIDATKGHWETEVHVLPGVTLTADGGSFGSSTVVIKQLEIYPGATVKVTTGTLNVTDLVLRYGWTRAGSKDYNVAQLQIKRGVGGANLTTTRVYADWYIDYDQYYSIAVPWKVTVANITYRNSSNAASGGMKLRYYDGEQRATTGQTMIGQNWKEYSPLPEYLEPSKGYALSARRPTGKAFSILRMPLTIPSSAWTALGEQGEVNSVPKNKVSVTGWGKGTAEWYAMGWNFIGNPYMSTFNGNDEGISGKIEYQDGGAVRYATIPDLDFQNYYQVNITEANLKPASGFFIQANNAEAQDITFNASKIVAPSAPARYTTVKEEIPEQEAYIRLSYEGGKDQMGLIIGEDYTEAYEPNADLAKVIGEGNFVRTYMHYSEMDLAYVAINETLAKEWIPVTVQLPVTGEYTFSLTNSSMVADLEGVYLIDYAQEGKVTNLIESDYAFTGETGVLTSRFAINAIVGVRKDPQGVDAIDAHTDTTKPVKFLYHDKVYILYRGAIYDATGKRVSEINK